VPKRSDMIQMARFASLQKRTFAILVATTIGLIVALGLPLRLVLLDSFLQLEDRAARGHLDRANAAIANQLDVLWTVTRDYANWDDTYAYLGGERTDYADVNFINQTYDFNKLSLVALYDEAGAVHWSKAYDLRAKRELATPAAFRQPRIVSALQARDAGARRVQGLVPTDQGPMLVAACPIHTSAGAGPRRGTLVLGQMLDPILVSEFARNLKLDMAVLRHSSRSGQGAKVADAEAGIHLLNEHTLAGYARIDDLIGDPYLVLRVVMQRDVFESGAEAMQLILLSVLLAGLMFGVVVHLALKRLVVQPVTELGERVRKVAERKDHSLRLDVQGDDEIARLGHDINGMLDALQGLHRQLETERQRAERLLLNIMPRSVADRLKAGEEIADSYREASVLFADLVGFTSLASHVPPNELLPMLDGIFSAFDELADQHGLEKIKTIGDAYMVVAGVPEPVPDHAQVLAAMGLDMVRAIEVEAERRGVNLQVRVGIHTGPVVAGVIGKRKFSYDLWGDTVNVASRMESSGVPGRVQVSEATVAKLGAHFVLEERGPVAVKGKGEMRAWLLVREAEVPSTA